MSSNLVENPAVGDTSYSPARRGKSRRCCKEKDGYADDDRGSTLDGLGDADALATKTRSQGGLLHDGQACCRILEETLRVDSCGRVWESHGPTSRAGGKRATRADSRTWEFGPTMQESRCGLGVTTLSDGTIYAAGGYAGNMRYLRSAEALYPGSDRWVRLPPMSLPRTGLGLVAGPDKRLYAVGGSADGSHGHSTMESFDAREGKWSACQPMVFGRAYCCAAFGASGCLYVLGGMSTPMGLRRTVEIYDPRTERWRVDDRSGSGGRAITDACLVFQPRS